MLIYLFWAAILTIFYSYAGFPLLLWLGGKLFGREATRQQITPRVTLFISAYNEEEVIAQKLWNSLELDYPRENLEIVVASESTDRTNDIVTAFANQGVRLIRFPGHRGKCWTMCNAVPRTTGEIIVFSDANAFYQPDAIRKLVRSFADPHIGCVVGRRLYEPEPGSVRTESLFVRYNSWVRSLQSRFFCQTGADGAIYAIRRELYFPVTEVRGDDFELPIRALLCGAGGVFEPEAIACERSSPTIAIEFRRRIRLVRWGFTSVMLLLAEAAARGKWLLAWLLVSHKLLPWLTTVWMAAALVTCANIPGAFYHALLILQMLFYALALVAWPLDASLKRIPMLLLFPYYWCAMHLATLLGVGRSFTVRDGFLWERLR